MPWNRFNTLAIGLGAAATTLSLACAAAWALGWLEGNHFLPSRSGVFLGCALVAAAAIWILVERQLRHDRAANRYLELLCELERRGELQMAPEHTLPTLDTSSPWFHSLDQLRTIFSEHYGRIDEAEHGRRAVEVRLRRSNEQCQRALEIINGISDPVLAIDRYGQVALANPSAEALLGLDLSGTTGSDRQILARIDRCQALVDLLDDARRRTLRTSKTQDIELEDVDGSRHWYSVTATGLTSETGGSCSATSSTGTTGAGGKPRSDNAGGSGKTSETSDLVVAVLRDISGEQQIRRQHAEFVSAVSHEMKAPLAGIKAYVELLADGEVADHDTREEFLGVIDSQAQRLQRLIDNLLNLARIEAGVVKVSKETQGLNEILDEAIGVVQPTAEGRQMRLERFLSPMYLGAHVDRDMILQAAINLLSNAIKYTPSGGSVTLRSRMLDGEVQFEVEDTGVGLSPEDCEKVFSKFYRVDRNKHMAAGTGLGLALARHIVEDVHGGSLTVRSQLDKGSTFTVTIPAASKTS